MLDSLQNLYYGGKFQISKMENHAEDSTLIAVTYQTSYKKKMKFLVIAMMDLASIKKKNKKIAISKMNNQR